MDHDRQEALRVQAGFNDNHRSRLAVSFRYVDELLADTLRTLSTDEADSPFPKYRHDATPVQRKVASDYIARLRLAMRNALDKWNIAAPEPGAGAVWSARCTIRSAAIAVEELGARYMRGYGALTDEAARDLNHVLSQLADLLDQLESYLAQGPVRDLRARLERLEPGMDGMRQIDMLRELERVITRHGVVELRATLEMLVERLESNGFEVAVFGRVSSGKSSLLNYVLGTNALPVGINPVTSIPVQITYGAEPWGRVWFVDATPEIIPLGRLAEFLSEQYNPQNRRHVTRMKLELPAALLSEGLAFIDTPGLGSLVTAGADEALAYLPRCDLGIVLIDAASTVVPDDIALVDSLQRSGAQAMVLISKSDLLTEAERLRAELYVGEQMESRTGVRVPVYPVSVKGEAAQLCERWVAAVLRPALHDHQELARASLARKIALLRGSLITALEKRLAAPGLHGEGAGEPQTFERILTDALDQWDAVRREVPRELSRLPERTGDILDEAAHNAAIILKQHHEAQTDIATLVRASLQSRAGVAATTVAQTLMKTRAVLENALAKLGAEAGLGEDGALARPAGMPHLDGTAVIPELIARKPAALAALGTGLLRREIRRQMAQAALENVISAALSRYHSLLADWRIQMFADLKRQFTTTAEVIRARVDPSRVRAGSTAADLEADLQSLQQGVAHPQPVDALRSQSASARRAQ